MRVTRGRVVACGLKDAVSEEGVAGIDSSEEVTGWGGSGMMS
jgi:hypothetical protein